MLRICLRQSVEAVFKVIFQYNVRREIRNTLQCAATKLLGLLTSWLPNAIIACSVRLERMPTCTPFQLIHVQAFLPEVGIGGSWYDGEKYLALRSTSDLSRAVFGALYALAFHAAAVL